MTNQEKVELKLLVQKAALPIPDLPEDSELSDACLVVLETVDYFAGYAQRILGSENVANPNLSIDRKIIEIIENASWARVSEKEAWLNQISIALALRERIRSALA
ncbi:MAG: hypothetical protein H7Y17_16475 [Chlorobia bacterium]|nr:hypothetical protein [Fimbriimonadaceae bacterium]